MFAPPAIAALNHLLTQNGWASRRLARFSGKTAYFHVEPFSFACTIDDHGLLREAAVDANADARCTTPPSLLPRLALLDDTAFAQIESSGDAELIAEIFFLARNLRWDAAEDLSRVTGDIAAERIVQLVRANHQRVRDGALNLSQALAEYWTEESPVLAKPQQLSSFTQEVNTLRDEVEQLELRIDALSSPLPSSARGNGE